MSKGNGCFYGTDERTPITYMKTDGNGNIPSNRGLAMSASRQVSTYTNSGTVKPSALALNYIIHS